MELSIFLSQVIGVYLVIIGLICLLRRKTMIAAVADMASNRAVIYLVAILELLAGLGLVISHNVWVWDITVVITIVGWVMLIEAVAYLLLPYKVVAKIFRRLNTKSWYIAGGLLSVVVGAYLAGIGFGWM